jgi:hypothetical protein
VEALVREHPLRAVTQDLRQHGQSIELSLALLQADAVDMYLTARFPGHQLPAALGPWLARAEAALTLQ